MDLVENYPWVGARRGCGREGVGSSTGAVKRRSTGICMYVCMDVCMYVYMGLLVRIDRLVALAFFKF